MSNLTEHRLIVRFVKNAVDWDLSVGAFEGQRMVGFTMVGVDELGGELSAYDAITGIIPDFRGQGLASRMFDHIVPPLRERGVRRFLLEVLQPNDAAIRAYRKAGFEVRRELDCFEIDPEKLAAGGGKGSGFLLSPVSRQKVRELEEFADWLPSWENRFSALDFIPDDVVCIGAMQGDSCVGALAYYPTLNWILTLVVRPEYRRRGIATHLLQALPEHLPAGTDIVRLINVDHGDAGMLELARRCGFSELVNQYEMEFRLDEND